MNAQSHIYSLWIELQNLAMMLLMNLRGLLANILMTKNQQAKLKQTWIADMRSKVLNHPIQKDFDDEMHSFSDWRSTMHVMFVLHSKRAFSNVLEGVT